MPQPTIFISAAAQAGLSTGYYVDTSEESGAETIFGLFGIQRVYGDQTRRNQRSIPHCGLARSQG